MLNLQLYVEGQEVDLFDDESVTLTQSIQDIMDIEKVFTDFSRTFNVPASKNNNKIFKHFHDPYIVGFDARFKKDAELHLNYKLFKKGKIKLEGATKKDNKAHTYRLTFYGSTITISDLFGEDKLSGLQFLTNYFWFTYNSANIKTYMEDGLDVVVGNETFTDAILFPLISHSKRFIYDSNHSFANTDTLNNIAYIADTDYNLEISQLKPALRIHAIIRAIEDKYKIKFSTDFFNVSNPVYNNLYLWLHNKKGRVTSGDTNETFVSNYTFTEDDGGVQIHPASFDLINNKSKRLNFAVIPTTNSPFNVIIYKDGEQLKRYDNVSLNFNDNTEWLLSTQEGGNLDGLVNGNISIGIESPTANTFNLRLHVDYVSGAFKRSRDTHFTATVAVGTETRINANTQIPKIKVIDFVTGIFKMFNLTAYVNDAGTIVVKTLASFYSESTKTWDVTDFIDKTTQSVNTVLPYKEVDFSFKGTDNFFAKSHEEQFLSEWGQLKYNVSEKMDGSVYKIELPFEHFKFERLYDVNGSTATDIQWGWSADINQEGTLGEPLLFYPILKDIGDIATSTGIMGIKDLEGSVSPKYAAYIPSNSLETTSSFNINFSAEYNEYQGTPFDSTLFKNYYQNYISEIFDPQKRLLKTKAFLPISMLSQFTLADKLRIFNDLYRINKITTNFETLQSDLELINSKETFGEDIFVPPIIPDKFITENKCIRADDDTNITDLYYLTADGSCDADGFVITSTNEVVPKDLDPSNNPEYIEKDLSPVVTASIIADVTPITVTSSEIYLSHQIVFLGKIGLVSNIDEYGFFYSITSSDLDSTNVDTLKANPSVSNIHFETNAFNKQSVIGVITAKLGSLSSGQTIYWKFYVRTNTNPLYAKADALSSKKTSTTL